MDTMQLLREKAGVSDMWISTVTFCHNSPFLQNQSCFHFVTNHYSKHTDTTPPRWVSASLKSPSVLPWLIDTNAAIPSLSSPSLLCWWDSVKRPTHSGVPPNWEESKWSLIGQPPLFLCFICSVTLSTRSPSHSLPFLASDWTFISSRSRRATIHWLKSWCVLVTHALSHCVSAGFYKCVCSACIILTYALMALHQVCNSRGSNPSKCL